MFVIKLLSQHVSGIIMSIFRSWVVSCVQCVKFTVRHTTCASTQSCSPEDGRSDARNMLR